MKVRYVDIELRYMQSFVVDVTGCWLWTGSIWPDGYAYLKVGGRKLSAHRLAHQLFIGRIPDGLVVDHVRDRGCCHRHCVNPAHLEAVTQRENLLRADTFQARNLAKTHCPNGHPYDDSNTYVNDQGHRQCRACRAARIRISQSSTRERRAARAAYMREWRRKKSSACA